MTDPIHKNLSAGRWQSFSLAMQMGNIGSEVSRAGKSQGKDGRLFWGAVERAIELFDLTLRDSRWTKRKKEISRAKEVFCDAVLGGHEYGSRFEDIQKYYDEFALLAVSKLS